MIHLTPCVWGIALAGSTLGGQLIVAPLMELARLKLEKPVARTWWVSFSVAIVERATITILFIEVPKLVPAFIGGWTVAKFAAGWGRIVTSDDNIRRLHMIALVGSVLSYAIAIGAGIWARPESLAIVGQ
jgi:hypothetical protein